MQNLHFSPQEREKLEKALKLFFERSSTQSDTIVGLNTFDIISYLGFLVDYGFFVDCSFGVGKKAKDTWIIFIRKDIPNIKASWGVYPRVCFHTASNQIEVSIDISTSEHKITKSYMSSQLSQKYQTTIVKTHKMLASHIQTMA